MTKGELRKIANALAIENCSSTAAYLGEVYKAVKAADPSYTYKKYSADSGLSESNVIYLIIKGERPLTERAAAKIAGCLALKGFVRRYFMQLLKVERAGDGQSRGEEMVRLMALREERLDPQGARQLAFFADWYNAAILEMLRMDEARDDADWISRHLQPSVPPGKVRRSLELLRELGYVCFDENKGRLVPSGAGVSTGDEARELAVTRYHQQMLALSEEAMNGIAAINRDISALTLAVNEKTLPRLKQELAGLRKRLIAEALKEGDDKDQVIQINVQLFPLVKGGKKE